MTDLNATLLSMRKELGKLGTDDLGSSEYVEVLFTFRLRLVSLLITIESLDGKETFQEFTKYCYGEVGLSSDAVKIDGVSVKDKFADLRSKWTEALTENKLALPFVSWDKFDTVSTFSSAEWATGKLPSDISKKALIEVKKSWDEFKKMIGLYMKGLMYAATQTSSRKTALANKTKNDEANKNQRGGGEKADRDQEEEEGRGDGREVDAEEDHC